MKLERAYVEETRRILAFWAPGIPAYAFGSRVTGHNLKPTSDIDICLRDDRAVAPVILRQVRNAFEVSALPMRVDVLDWHDISSDFQKLIEPHLERI